MAYTAEQINEILDEWQKQGRYENILEVTRFLRTKGVKRNEMQNLGEKDVKYIQQIVTGLENSEEISGVKAKEEVEAQSKKDKEAQYKRIKDKLSSDLKGCATQISKVHAVLGDLKDILENFALLDKETGETYKKAIKTVRAINPSKIVDFQIKELQTSVKETSSFLNTERQNITIAIRALYKTKESGDLGTAIIKVIADVDALNDHVKTYNDSAVDTRLTPADHSRIDKLQDEISKFSKGWDPGPAWVASFTGWFVKQGHLVDIKKLESEIKNIENVEDLLAIKLVEELKLLNQNFKRLHEAEAMIGTIEGDEAKFVAEIGKKMDVLLGVLNKLLDTKPTQFANELQKAIEGAENQIQADFGSFREEMGNVLNAISITITTLDVLQKKAFQLLPEIELLIVVLT